MSNFEPMRAGFQMAQRATNSGHQILMPRDENDARGIAAYFGLTGEIVTANLGPLGISVETLRRLSAELKGKE